MTTVTPALPAGFGRIARSYPAAMPSAAHPPAAAAATSRRAAQSLRRQGLAASLAHIGAVLLARAAKAARQSARRWAQQTQRRATERALQALDARTLRDLGLGDSEISSIAAEAAGEVEATRARVWKAIGPGVF